jgi:putative ABC transport system substrate-binding protein
MLKDTAVRTRLEELSGLVESLNVKVIVGLDKILKGAKPGDLPVERLSQFDSVVNQRTARDIGVTVSAAALLRATKVVE